MPFLSRLGEPLDSLGQVLLHAVAEREALSEPDCVFVALLTFVLRLSRGGVLPARAWRVCLLPPKEHRDALHDAELPPH